MKKMWLVVRHEYLKNLRSPAFLLAAFGMPVFIIVIMAVVTAVTVDSVTNLDEVGSVGYVDQAGIVTGDVESELFIPVASASGKLGVSGKRIVRILSYGAASNGSCLGPRVGP